MLNPMPINGAAACRLPDPQEREALLLADCSGPGCHQQVYGVPEGRYVVESGLYFCCPACRDAYDLRKGDIIRCCERGM